MSACRLVAGSSPVSSLLTTSSSSSSSSSSVGTAWAGAMQQSQLHQLQPVTSHSYPHLLMAPMTSGGLLPASHPPLSSGYMPMYQLTSGSSSAASSAAALQPAAPAPAAPQASQPPYTGCCASPTTMSPRNGTTHGMPQQHPHQPAMMQPPYALPYHTPADAFHYQQQQQFALHNQMYMQPPPMHQPQYAPYDTFALPQHQQPFHMAGLSQAPMALPPPYPYSSPMPLPTSYMQHQQHQQSSSYHTLSVPNLPPTLTNGGLQQWSVRSATSTIPLSANVSPGSTSPGSMPSPSQLSLQHKRRLKEDVPIGKVVAHPQQAPRKTEDSLLSLITATHSDDSSTTHKRRRPYAPAVNDDTEPDDEEVEEHDEEVEEHDEEESADRAYGSRSRAGETARRPPARPAEKTFRPPPGMQQTINLSLEPEVDPKSGVLSYVCKFANCGDVFKTRFSLKRHLKKHSGEKPYPCSYSGCTKRFAEKSTLKRHVRIHTGEKPYKCTFAGCGKFFADRTNVKRHEMIHSGVFGCTDDDAPSSTSPPSPRLVGVELNPGPVCPESTCARGYFYRKHLRAHMHAVHQRELLSGEGGSGEDESDADDVRLDEIDQEHDADTTFPKKPGFDSASV